MIDLHVVRRRQPAPGAKHPEAEQRGREVWIYPKFNRLPNAAAKRHVLFHEMGHWFREEHVPLADIMGFEEGERYFNVYGAGNSEEGFAEAFATYFTDPRHLKGRYPGLYDEIEKLVAPLERDLLRWVSDAIVKVLRESHMPRGVILGEVKIPPGAYRTMSRWSKGEKRDSVTVAIDLTTGTLDVSGYANQFGRMAGSEKPRYAGVVEISFALGQYRPVVKVQTPHDPRSVEVLKALVKMDPNIASYAVHTPLSTAEGSVKAFVRKYSRRASEPSGPTGEPPIPALYHGTSSVFHSIVKSQGLRPRGATGTAATYGGTQAPSIPDRVYVGALETAKDAAHKAANLHGGVPVVYKVKVPGTALLEPDEDSDEPTWWRSLRKMGALAYKGRVPANHVIPYVADPKRASKTHRAWVKWDGRAFRPEEEWESEAARHARYKQDMERERLQRLAASVEAQPNGVPLHEADPTRDARFRKIAEHAYDVMRGWLDKHGDEIDDLLPRSKRWGGWVANMAELDGRRGGGGQWADLNIVFATTNHLPAMGMPPNSRTFYIILPVLIAPFSTLHLTSRAYDSRVAFIHEFIHYLDEKRYPAGTVQQSAAKRDAGDIKGYFHTPAEFNAFYQEGASKLISDIDTTVSLNATMFAPHGKQHPRLAILSRAVHGTARDWMTWLRAQRYWYADFLEAAKGSKWERKFLTRASLLQQTARKRISKVESVVMMPRGVLLWEAGREKLMGQTLLAAEPSRRFRTIYRGVLAVITEFKPDDYVTLKRAWAITHAGHIAAVEEEDAHVIQATVRAEHVREAPNPGEYFYVGPSVRGRAIKRIAAS